MSEFKSIGLVYSATGCTAIFAGSDPAARRIVAVTAAWNLGAAQVPAAAIDQLLTHGPAPPATESNRNPPPARRSTASGR